ncbi:hypothetical protein ACGF0J_14575 [Nonomuraea sp. NPDC047897]|jgi:hypothetical protein|uniref:hypothetical protein n=1 Tax=Nonomuraea sp. NPDC047897 TaxID=3364346 RepID=UPI00372002E7
MNDHLVRLAHSHLYPGITFEAPPDAADFLLLFTDDSESRTQLLRDTEGRPVLRVGARMNPKGTVVDEQVWEVLELVEERDLIVVRLGNPIPAAAPR